ncbi:hypothetical protein KFE25_001171 [Diacronema lutheri]|uniref:Nickel/cobalt efflux system n=1 Tax=Diacronema lutheri TaxID=2081491 RepID=A0A8J5XI87_DIALT|nr:hypothetical protein KFE25_001171 [Diacronema lutheri]
MLPTLLSASLRRKAGALVALLALGVAVALATLGMMSASYSPLLSPGLFAFSLGLRHAVDVDHIAAIDNVTRKLMSDEQQPLLVGFWFSLGHSTVVCLACVVLTSSSSAVVSAFPRFAAYSGVVGAAFSSVALILVSGYNAITALRLDRRWRCERRAAVADSQQPLCADAQEAVPPHCGVTSLHAHPISLVVRPAEADGGAPQLGVDGLGCATQSPCCGAIFKLVDAPWKLFPVGFLFGLGFDTATEVTLLALATALPSRSCCRSCLRRPCASSTRSTAC